MSRPNILLLHTDQQRFDTIHALGAEWMETPNLDRLAARSATFTHAYSSNPICMPARHDLLTGVSARHHGYWKNTGRCIQDPGLATMPRLLSQADYQTFAVGKMHFYPAREHYGFAHMFLMEELPTCREDDAYVQYLEEQGYGDVRCEHGVRPLWYHTPQVSRVPEEHHGSAWIATKSIELINEQRERPWFIFASWVGPHPPLYVPESYLKLYEDRELPDPLPIPEEEDLHTPVSPGFCGTESKRLGKIREAYYAAITLIDTHIGRILDSLEETGQLDNTLIIFTSDHGEMLGDRGVFQKVFPYEGSAHIPMMISGPGVSPGHLVDTPVNTWDTTATILAAAGIEHPGNPDLLGQDMRELACRQPERTIIFQHGTDEDRYVAATDGRYKFIHYTSGGHEVLFDLEQDPNETTNLLTEEPAVVAPLRRACLAFERQHGPPERTSEAGFADLPYQPPYPHGGGEYPVWSSNQFPRWMFPRGEEDFAAIEAEMDACLAHPQAALTANPEWRQDALQRWQTYGGDPAVYERYFAEIDRRGAAN